MLFTAGLKQFLFAASTTVVYTFVTLFSSSSACELPVQCPVQTNRRGSHKEEPGRVVHSRKTVSSTTANSSCLGNERPIRGAIGCHGLCQGSPRGTGEDRSSF
ncbi:unnamed protein product [Ectocarpus sp. 12 AP-2014]